MFGKDLTLEISVWDNTRNSETQRNVLICNTYTIKIFLIFFTECFSGGAHVQKRFVHYFYGPKIGHRWYRMSFIQVCRKFSRKSNKR